MKNEGGLSYFGFHLNSNYFDFLVRVFIVCVFLLTGFFAIYLSYRSVISSGFNSLPGDRYDMVIMSTILEHWRNFWSGSAKWHDVGYFYPYERTIAQTDAYFLIGVVYSVVRIFVDDFFVSIVIASFVLSGIGFCSIFFLARKNLGLGFNVSIFVSIAFVMLNSVTSHGQRLQLLSVYFLPILTAILISYLNSVWARDARFATALKGGSFGLFYGAMTLTCFYVAWFYLLFLLVFFFLLLCFKRRLVFDFFHKLLFLKCTSLAVLVVFFISLLPFAWAYYPKSLEVGVRSFPSVFGNLIVPLELIQVGFGNYLYGGILARVFEFFYPGYTPWGEYYNVGFSPLIFLLFLSGVYYFRPRRPSRDVSLFFLVGLAVLFCCLLLTKIGGFSLWYYVYMIVPGAKALNAVSVFLIVLALPVLLVVAKYIDAQNFHHSFFLVLAVVVLLGEINPPYINFDRRLENGRIEGLSSPPNGCESFYVSAYADQANISGFPEWINSMYAHNVTAMLVSQIVKIPTVNGVASFNPRDWNFSAPWAQSYDERVLQYADKHSIRSLCKLDLNSKLWSKVK